MGGRDRCVKAERLGRSCLSIIPRSRSHARLRRNATMSHAFCLRGVENNVFPQRSAGADLSSPAEAMVSAEVTYHRSSTAIAQTRQEPRLRHPRGVPCKVTESKCLLYAPEMSAISTRGTEP
ncbi:hypothetical protein EVAR_19389_1 [Eumeta japonica]|uniref:Uncharacterized protein n=1 Tax=Eumeta variegata TaxID=151549 RepID=A0A4C1TRQ5_EUMVA|nr:hypothetical protein EVAR_19389_1 [Eumeta japonica]